MAEQITVRTIRQALRKAGKLRPVAATKFFKTGEGDYAAHDRFLGVRVPEIRKIAAGVVELPLAAIQQLITSEFNEERLFALFILIRRYQCGDDTEKKLIFAFYLKNISHINNWNLVDASAHLIIGAHLLQARSKDRQQLILLAQSPVLWERRIAIVSTLYFIRHGELEFTLKLAKILLNDEHDLMHKATGWMLREVGKQSEQRLTRFIDRYGHRMPRTMLRYAIEKWPENKRQRYLAR